MEFLCKLCDKSNTETELKYNNYIATLKQEHDKSIYENFTIINPNLDEIDKILNVYNTEQNRKFDIILINCEFNLLSDNIFKKHIETNYCYNNDDITEINKELFIILD